MYKTWSTKCNFSFKDKLLNDARRNISVHYVAIIRGIIIMRSSMKHALYQDFFPHMLIFLRKCFSNHETKQASKFQSDPSSNCFTIDVWNINCWRQQFIFLLSYCFFRQICISFYTSFVVFWHVIFGNRFVLGTIFI